MTTKPEFASAKARLLLGVILLLAAPALTWGQWYSTKGPLETLAWYEAHRTTADSVAFASALYHATHARATQAKRWSPTGYATVGVIGTLVGLALVLSSRRRSGTQRSEP